MNPRTLYRLLIAGAILIVLTVVTNAASGQWAVQPPPAITTPPPTPGPQPTLVPDTSTGVPVTSHTEAIRRVVALEKFWAAREQSLTEEQIAAHPDRVVVEYYATRGEASDVYSGGHFGDPEIESEPVWVVIIKGKVHVTIIGIAGRDGPVEADGVTYIISARTGKVLEVAAGILQKQK